MTGADVPCGSEVTGAAVAETGAVDGAKSSRAQPHSLMKTKAIGQYWGST
jgi:hypothetical protein